MPITLNASTASGLVVTPDNSGVVAIQNNGTTELTITSTGVSVADNLSFNSGYGSSAVAYGCRAWVNFNGTGTPAIRASGNVSSITDNGTGDYTVNFTNSMPDANYAAAFMLRTSATTRFETAVIRGDVDPTTASLRFVTGISTYGVDNYQLDSTIVNVSIFR